MTGVFVVMQVSSSRKLLIALTMDDRLVGNGVGGVKEIAVYICWGRVLHDGMNGVMTYVGGNTVCTWVSQEMGLSNVWKLLEDTMRVAVMDMNVWYSMTFDRRLLTPFQRDGDVINMMQGNDGHTYLHVYEVGGPFVRPMQVSHQQAQAEAEVAMWEGLQMACSRNGSLELV